MAMIAMSKSVQETLVFVNILSCFENRIQFQFAFIDNLLRDSLIYSLNSLFVLESKLSEQCGSHCIGVGEPIMFL